MSVPCSCPAVPIAPKRPSRASTALLPARAPPGQELPFVLCWHVYGARLLASTTGASRRHGTSHHGPCPELPLALGAEELVALRAPPFLKIPFCTQCFPGRALPCNDPSGRYR